MGEPEKIQPIIFEFFRKVVQVILESRIHSVLKSDSSPVSCSKPSSPVKREDKWFNLNLGVTDNVKPPILEQWSKIPTTEPMFVEILLVGSDGNSISRQGGQSSRGLILERWAVQYAQNASSSAFHADMQRSMLYKKAVILLRSLYCTTKLLPAYRVYRDLQKSPLSNNARKLTYRISASPMTLPKGIMENHNFTPVETQCGKLCLSVSYLANLICRHGSEVDRLESPITQLIPDYCRSPDSERRFHGTSRGKHNVLSAPSSPGFRTPGFGRCHSWSGVINKILVPYTVPQQSPSHRFSMMPTNPNLNYHGTSMNSRTPPLPVPPQRTYSIVDRFASPSPSPPMRSRLSNESVSRGLIRTGSLPQNMDQNRNILPLHREVHAWEAHALSRAVSANSKLMAVYSHSALSSTSTSGNSIVPQQAHSGYKDDKDDNVSLRGTLSRGSSRRSYTNEVEDEDFSCLFALDSDDSDGHRSRTDSHDGKLCLQEVMGVPGQTVSTPRRSRTAALGELIEMFKSAPPLQQHIGNALDFSQVSADIWRDDSTRENFQCHSKGNQCAVSSSTVYSNDNHSRGSSKTSKDGLEELQNYKEIKDCLLRQSGVPEGGAING